MDELAKVLLALSWSDMDEFARRITAIATDDEGEANNEHYIAGCLVDWAREILSQ